MSLKQITFNIQTLHIFKELGIVIQKSFRIDPNPEQTPNLVPMPDDKLMTPST